VLDGVRGVKQIALGFAHACAIARDDTALCWGGNVKGELGDGTKTPHETPEPVRGLDGVAELALGMFWSCALRLDGTVWCWGDDLRHRFGEDAALLAPTQLELEGVVRIASSRSHVCALRSDGSVWCWGSNDSAALGRPYEEGRDVDVVPGLPGGLIDVAVGPSSSCALTAARVAWCWGDWGTALDEVSSDTHNARATPRIVVGFAGAQQIASGYGFTCALLGDGTVSCLGANDHGQLGDGTTDGRFASPVQGLHDVVEIAAEDRTVCARRSD